MFCDCSRWLSCSAVLVELDLQCERTVATRSSMGFESFVRGYFRRRWFRKVCLMVFALWVAAWWR